MKVNEQRRKKILKIWKRDRALYLMALAPVLLVFVFNYIPLYGILMAFQNHVPAKGIWGSKWVGLKHFETFFRDPFCFRIIKNTFLLGAGSLIVGFPAPIIFALLVNEVRQGKFKRVVQTISYMPHFISTVILVGIMKNMFRLSGIVNELVVMLGGEAVDFFTRPEWFRPLYIGSGIWQGVGYSSILYLAAIAGVSPELYESAILDGASRFKQIIYITIPSIMPTITIMFIMAMGGVLGNDMQKILLMYNELTYETSDVISTYVYRKGLLGGQFSYSTAVGLFTSLINFMFLFTANKISRKMGETSLF